MNCIFGAIINPQCKNCFLTLGVILMEIGTVKWFDAKKGFGFISQNESQEDIFVHFREIKVDGFKTLKDGQQVEFELENGDKGKQALNVRPAS